VITAIPDVEISAVRFCSYTVRRTQYDRVSKCGGPRFGYAVALDKKVVNKVVLR